MYYCEQRWTHASILKVTQSDQDHCRQILSQASPSLIRILQTIKVLQGWGLLTIHFLLDFSWDELRTVICSLCSLMHNEREVLIRKLFIVALDPAHFPMPFGSIMWDLACVSLCFMQQTLRGEADNLMK
jgi:hypothetical protein